MMPPRVSESYSLTILSTLTIYSSHVNIEPPAAPGGGDTAAGDTGSPAGIHRARLRLGDDRRGGEGGRGGRADRLQALPQQAGPARGGDRRLAERVRASELRGAPCRS